MPDVRDQQKQRRLRRRQRRAIAIGGFLLLAIGLAWFFESQATTTVIVTRYADVPPAAGGLPTTGAILSPQGERRARELARLLGDVDVVAGIDAIFVTDHRRSRDTGAPLAAASSAPVHTVQNPADVEGLVQRVLSEYKGKIVLIITEPELLQPVIAEMQGSKKLPELAPDEYDNLYIVTIPWFGKVKTLRLHFGMPYQPAVAPAA
ncbi:MAG: hypothetical protein V2J12_05055 [Gammaproteobacteria bacterium]|jgi:hypothetical protein|nr:hypothetical protein [Gammaproteobacteria bacterium]